MSEDKVSVIIATYNRFFYLLNTIESVKSQTYKNLEIIVVNDKSTQKEYYEYDFESNGIKIIHLVENSKTVHGFACPGGYQRNFGMSVATGKYIAFCDDDDSWFPNKLTLQISKMKQTGCKMSHTEALIGRGIFDANKKYIKYNDEYAYEDIVHRYKIYNCSPFNNDGSYKTIIDLDIMKINNCFICSSVVIEKEIIDKTGLFKSMPTADDYEYWLRVLQHTNSVYIHEPCVYYDELHGNGQNY